MKKIVLAAMMVPMAAAAQNYNRGVSVSDIAMTGSGTEVLLEMTLDIERDAVTRLQGIAVVPTLSDGTDQADFPCVLVNGRNRNRIFERQRKFRNTEIMQNPPSEVMVIDRKHRGGRIDYSAGIAAEPWMEGAGLSLRFVLVSPAGERQYYTAAVSGVSVATAAQEVAVAPEPVIEATPEPAVQKPIVETRPVIEATPVAPAVKRHTVEGSAYLDFKAGSSMLVLDQMRNTKGLASIEREMRGVTNNPNTRITALEIVGYSSPEGRFDANETLAYERAHELALYLRNAYRIPAGISKVRAVGEDWQGLREMVAGSDMPHRWSVLEIIDGTEHPDVKESKLRRISGGQAWRAMTDYMFPELRRVEYRIDYEVTE